VTQYLKSNQICPAGTPTGRDPVVHAEIPGRKIGSTSASRRAARFKKINPLDMKTTQAEELLRTRPMTPEVLAISKLQIVGDVVPNSWYHNITLPSGRSDALGIVILAHIVSWYVGQGTYFGNTDQIIRAPIVRSTEPYHATYKEIAERFCVTARMARNACHRLKKAGLLTIHIEPKVHLGDDLWAYNVAYFIPNWDKITELDTRNAEEAE